MYYNSIRQSNGKIEIKFEHIMDILFFELFEIVGVKFNLKNDFQYF